MGGGNRRLHEVWRMRNAAAEALVRSEEQLRAALCTASLEELVTLIESFSPALSAGPEWTRTFDPLIERLWTWRDDATMAALAADFKARGVPWAGVANAFLPEHGVRIRAELRHPPWARLPAFTVA